MSGTPSLQARIRGWAGSGAGYHLLLAFLFWMLLVQPGGQGGAEPSLVSRLVSIGVFATALFAVAGNRTVLVLGTILLLPPLVLTVLAPGGAWAGSLVGQGFGLAFLVLITGTFLRRIFSHETVTAATLSAAACVYLFIGIGWSYGYRILVGLDPTSMAGLDGSGHDLFYFSFVTLTTLGFGDITPVSRAARAMVTVEALVGQLYLVITVARLVALYGHRVTTVSLQDPGPEGG